MSRHHTTPAQAPPLDNQDLLEEILVRLPPQPSSLPRASLVCKRWRSILSDPKFLKHFREHHRKPPLIGFFVGTAMTENSLFTPALEPPDRIPFTHFSMPESNIGESSMFTGCRHGLAVIVHPSRCEIVVWDPLTSQQHRVAFPSGIDYGQGGSFQASVLCSNAEDGHVHGDCFLSPFKLVLISIRYREATVSHYESASGLWENSVSIETTRTIFMIRSSILVGNAICWSKFGGDVLVYDTDRKTLGVIEKPADAHIVDCWSFQLLRRDNGSRLGFAVLSELNIHLWERKTNSNDVVEWVAQQKIIKLDLLFPYRVHCSNKKVTMVGYDEESNVIVLATYIGDFMLRLD